MIRNGVAIADNFAEAFGMIATRLIITADSPAWARIAAESMTGYATSVIACGCEAGIERDVSAAETPDNRPGVAVLFFGMNAKGLQEQIRNRLGQCVLTAAGSACFAGIAGEKRLRLGGAIRYFGDGFQIAKKFGARRYWRIPVMDGEFICEHDTGLAPGIGGGNFLLLASTRTAALKAAECAVAAMRRVPGIIMPFPGGVVRSGSKVGSRYKGMIASTNDAYCPTLRGQTTSALPANVGAVLEIVIDGLTAEAIATAMRAGIVAACEGGAASGLIAIDAGNYGGKLGPHHFHLRAIMA